MKEWLAAINTASRLMNFASEQLAKTASELTAETAGVGTGFAFSVGGRPHSESDAVAVQKLGYPPDFVVCDQTVLLSLNTGRHDALEISFHGIGPSFRGLIGVAAYLQVQGAEPDLLEGGTFQINYEEDLAAAEARFSAWLNRVIVAGLNSWRLTL